MASAAVVGSSRLLKKFIHQKFLEGKISKRKKASFVFENNTGSLISPAAVRICGG
jgi:hypothetical protein